MRQVIIVDGNEAVARVAHKLNEVIAIYPITPSSPMGELADQWSAQRTPNLWGTVPLVQEMQSEGGAAGAVHGALQAGALTTTFTASQGLLLMIPNMYKIAGELTSTVFHIAARSLATQGLSIFADHSDVMATRATGWSMLFAGSVQEAQDLSLIAQASTLKSRIPFLHVMDGFRTSHEVMKIEALCDDDLKALVDDELVRAHRARALSPDRPFIRGTAQNPDIYFQARETVNPYYAKVPAIVQGYMNQLAERTGRQYRLFEYVGAPDSDRVVVLMGSGAETVRETVDYLVKRGEKVGVLKVRLYRPFDVQAFIRSLPPSVRVIAALDRSKEPGSAGEPLYQDLLTAVAEGGLAARVRVVGGRYGLSSKEFTPAMVVALLEEMKKPEPKNHFTLGIHDDVSHISLAYDPMVCSEPPEVKRSVFWGLGSDGTVGANKNSIKIIGEETDYFAQGYFVYDSKKAGARTISHLRFGPEPIRSSYLIQQADFVAVHQFGFFERYRVLDTAQTGATLLINSPYTPQETWDHLPYEVQAEIIEKKLKVYVINAYEVARQVGLGTLMNTVMQVCFFALSGVLPRQEAIGKIKESIRQTYGKRGEAVIRKNFAAVDAALPHLYPLEVPEQPTSSLYMPPAVPTQAPEFVQTVTAAMLAGTGDALPVSALPADGTYPSGTSQWEKRNIAQEVPVWDPAVCIQCGKCVLVCPHAVIRAKVVSADALATAPQGFQTAAAMWKGLEEQRYTLQVAVEDCTGCELCVEVCPAKNKRQVGRKAINMAPQLPLREQGSRHWEFFLSLPDYPRHDGLHFNNVKNVQLLHPLFEFSGACAGCGETPYLKLLSQLFGDRCLIANATGCSSIYGGNLPTTPWSKNREGRGPAWSNSLFEDNAEFGLGMRLTLDKHSEYARELLGELKEQIGARLAQALLETDQSDEAGIAAQRKQVAALKARLQGRDDPKARDLLSLADVLVRKSVWIVGGDGWAYDIDFGGLDHVLATGRNVKLLVLDTEVYSNTGGQSSKATSLAAVAKFASGGKTTPKKDLGRMVMGYRHVYVAQVAMGANDAQTVRAFLEAESYQGPAMIIAYSHCIAHGIDMAKGLLQQRLAAESAYWPLYRYDPRLRAEGENPFQLDSKPPRISFQDYALHENRYRILQQINPQEAGRLFQAAQEAILTRWKEYEQLAQMPDPRPTPPAAAPKEAATAASPAAAPKELASTASPAVTREST
jgi:pyruvate-ferredoxin/flavodoxin oxidoreductase